MIHKYSIGKYNFILDVNSSCVHIVDDLTYKLLDYIDENMTRKFPNEILKEFDFSEKNDVIKCYEELYRLKIFGKLFSKENKRIFSYITQSFPIKSMCLNVAHDCDLRCKYCFASTGNFGGKRILMPFEVGKKAIDFLIKSSGLTRNLEVDFFGGEPLMNFEVVKQIIFYARKIENEHSKNFRFTITTNGLLLDGRKINFINHEMSNVVLSLDGRKFVNDNFRKTLDGEGSYDVILPMYKKLIIKRPSDKDYYIRGTFTKYNLDFTQDVLHLANLGFKHISIEPVVSDNELPYSINFGDLEKVKLEYEKLAYILLEKHGTSEEFNFFHFFVDLDDGPCIIKRAKGCGCGNEYVAITPDGDIFPCHQFVGDNSWKMGNIMNDTFDKKMKNIFSKTNIYFKKDCKNCFAKFFCSGGCVANSWRYEKDLLKSHKISCELQKKRLECAIMFQALKKIKSKNKQASCEIDCF